MLLGQLGISGLCVLILLGSWFLITIPHQFTNRLGKRVKQLNTLGIIPGWTFFAPTPGTTDYRFVYRDIHGQERTDWMEVEWCKERRLVDAVWHPERHRTKLIVDCVSGFVLTVEEMRKLGVSFKEPVPPWIISVPYLALLNVAVRMP